MVRSGGHGLLEQQQALQQRGLADELLPSSMVTGASCTAPLSRQALRFWRWSWSIMAGPSYGGGGLNQNGLQRLCRKRQQLCFW